MGPNLSKEGWSRTCGRSGTPWGAEALLSAPLDSLEVRGGGTNLHPQDEATKDEDNLFSMNGPEVFKYSLPKVYQMILSILKRNQLSQADVDLLIPHQASGKGVKAYWKFGGFDKTKVMDIVNETGNCVAASLPLALVMAFEQKKINKDDIVLLVGTGAGLSIASAIIKL